MRVVEVIPVMRGITRATLSYFTKDKFPIGSFVKIPIRNGHSQGVIVGSKDARLTKTSVKSANFTLKKIALTKENSGLATTFMKAIQDTANSYATTVGSVLGALVPKIFFDHPEILGKPIKTKVVGANETKVVQLPEDERFREYRGIVRESFAKGSSVLLILPTKEEVLEAEKKLSLGIENFIYSPSRATPKELVPLLSKALEEKHPILFITTPPYLAFSRKDLRTIILERESSKVYRTLARPFLSIKTFLEHYAKRSGASLILSDSVLSIETLWHEREGRYSELTPLSWRQKSASPIDIIDMREKKDFQVLSDHLVKVMKGALLENKKIFLFGVRKGISPTTICGDCASLLLCRNCKAPLVLHKDTYVCHHCGAKRSTETRCDNCQSWRLNPIGIGIDRIFEECKTQFEGAEIFLIDKEHTPTKNRAKEVAKNFEDRGGILIGTELALSFIKRAHIVGVVSLDPLFSIPDFHINEKIFYLITRLREIAREHFLIQTRNAGAEILKFGAEGNVLDFYRSEIKDREELEYPPFSLFIKVMVQGSKERLERKASELKSMFREYEPHFIIGKEGGKNLETLSMILRLKIDTWPNEELKNKLLLLTPDFLIKVDPESII